MKKTAFLLSLVMCAAVFCSCGNNDKEDGSGHMFDVALNGNPQSLDPQFAYDPASNTVIKNLYSGLMRVDESGNVVCCHAEKYVVKKHIGKFLCALNFNYFRHQFSFLRLSNLHLQGVLKHATISGW